MHESKPTHLYFYRECFVHFFSGMNQMGIGHCFVPRCRTTRSSVPNNVFLGAEQIDYFLYRFAQNMPFEV